MPPTHPEEPIRVLIVDDEPALLDLTKTFLEEAKDLAITTVGSGAQALTALETQSFDVVVSDYQMPGMDGVSLLMEMRKRSQLPFILFTGKGREEIVIMALNNGADFYLQKGGDPISMYTMLDHHIRSTVRERKFLEGLKFSETMLKKLFDVSFVALSATDEQGRMIEWNKRAEEITGLSADEVLGKYAWDVISDISTLDNRTPEFRDRLRKSYEDDLRDGINEYEQGIVTDGAILHRDGHVVYFSQQLFSIATAKGFRLYTVILETTKYRQAEMQARENEEKFRGLFNNASDAMLFHTIDGQMIDVNKAACELYGLSKEELMQKAPWEMDVPESKSAVESRIKQLQKSNSLTFVTAVIGKEGKRIDVEISSRLIESDGKSAFLSIIRDITERKRMEEGLKRALDQINLLSQITRHDIKNQLVIGKGHLALIEESLGEKAPKKKIEKLKTALDNIERQIDFTRVYQDLGTTPPSWHGLLDVISSIPQTHISPEIELGEGVKELEIYADPMIEKVFYNLIENTVRYGDKPPKVRIDANPRGQCLMITYEDVGPGIPPEEKELIFQKGYGKGTGLGLFLSRNILLLTGIKIAETGEPGKGVRFEMCVPIDKHRYTASKDRGSKA